MYTDPDMKHMLYIRQKKAYRIKILQVAAFDVIICFECTMGGFIMVLFPINKSADCYWKQCMTVEHRFLVLARYQLCQTEFFFLFL